MPRPLALSIADWLVLWRERAWPIDWAAELGREAPLALEIGFGNGEYLEREARRRPERNHLGIELSWTSATHLFRRLDRGGLPHVRALRATRRSRCATSSRQAPWRRSSSITRARGPRSGTPNGASCGPTCSRCSLTGWRPAPRS